MAEKYSSYELESGLEIRGIMAKQIEQIEKFLLWVRLNEISV
jgi:hypothetical protein